MVPQDGLEPSLPKKSDFESDVSTNSTTAAKILAYLQSAKNSALNLS